jgi:hypothetical protein
MTIAEALSSSNIYPIPVLAIEKICLDRDLIPSTTYTKVIGISQSFELAIADVLMYLHDSPSIVEQEMGINNAISIKREMMDRANKIYGKYDDSKYCGGGVIGFIGENWNG